MENVKAINYLMTVYTTKEEKDIIPFIELGMTAINETIKEDELTELLRERSGNDKANQVYVLKMAEPDNDEFKRELGKLIKKHSEKDKLRKASEVEPFVHKAQIVAMGGMGVNRYEIRVTMSTGERQTVFIPCYLFVDMGIIKVVRGVSSIVKKWLNSDEGRIWLLEYIKEKEKENGNI